MKSIANPQPSADFARAIPAIEGGALRWRDVSTLPYPLPQAKQPVVLVPSEDVLLVVVDLPLSSNRQRVEAVPFAVEGMLAEPLSAVHVALGPQVAPKRYVAAIVRHATLAHWTDILTKAGLAQARMLPDALTLPIPHAGSWAVKLAGTRALVRRDDGSAFAAGTPALIAAWRIAGCPAVTSYGEILPAPMIGTDPAGTGEADAVTIGFDLRQGLHASKLSRHSGLLRRAGWISGVGAAVLAAVFVVETLALDRLAATRRAQAGQQLQSVQPGIVLGDDLAQQLARLAPTGTEQPRGRFLPLLARVSAALGPESNGLSVQNMSYDATDNELAFDVSAENLAALQRIESALTGAGLQATSGVATADKAAAEVRIVVLDDAAGGGS